MHVLLSIWLVALLGVLQPPATSTPPVTTPPATPVGSVAPPTPTRLDWTIDGVKREAIIYVPGAAKTTPSPVVFAFHGHGGNARHAATAFEYQKHWPEAISVYMQGLPTPGALTDPQGKRDGWQKTAGDQNDRDLKFFDAVLATLRSDYKIDDARIYSTGHSNGGGFTYLLWSTRGDVLAAVAPSSAGPGGVDEAVGLKPKPCMHIAGEKDELVPFKNQQRTMARVRKVNNCEGEPTEWGAGAILYPSRSGAPFVSVIHPGGHRFHAGALPLIVKFFKEHTNPAPAARPDPNVEPIEPGPSKAPPTPNRPAAPGTVPHP